VLDCEALAGPDHGRTATAADVERIVEVLNAGHEGEEMYLPHTAESFTTRMERAPELYSWGKVLIGDGAVVGVWPAGLRVAIDGPDGNTRSVRAVVLDHGFVPGAEAEFDRLVRAWCARLVSAGHSELTLATSEPSPSYPWVAPVASRMDAFLFRMSVPEPEGASTRGLYVDAVYF
jgi:hypothetical protein